SRKEEALAQEYQRIQKELTFMEGDSLKTMATLAAQPKQKEMMQKALESESPGNLEIYDMIQQARDAILGKQYELARQIYTSIQFAYEQLDLDLSKKRQIYFDVLELKTDIELGSLA
ncbi:TPA: nucleoprotein, partial [Candidatus Woesearchaeota archaeon]|nr:nucleoprotein [Candidatus Woesearchaeota archaeon]